MSFLGLTRRSLAVPGVRHAVRFATQHLHLPWNFVAGVPVAQTFTLDLAPSTSVRYVLELGNAQGTASRISIRAGSRQLSIHASDYRAGYCAAEASADGFATVTNAIGFGAGRSRTFWFDNLNPNIIYQYRARCDGGRILTGQAQTRILGVDRRFQLRLRPPAWMTSAHPIQAVIFTGASPTSLSTVNTLLCTTGCTLEMPAVDGVLLYFRVEYRRPGNVTVAKGPIRAWAP